MKLPQPTPAAEVLESRIAPAVLTPGVSTYTDGNGDVVKIQVAGKFTSVDFLDAAQHDVLTNGGDIASVVVTGAGPDFALTFADTSSAGDGVIELGTISGPSGARLPLIKGISTIAADGAATFHLGGFIGAGFSPNGGLNLLGDVTGSAAAGSGLDVKTIGASNMVTLRDGIAAGATVKLGNVAGSFSAGTAVDGTLDVANVTGTLLLGEVSGKVTITNSLAGRLVVADTAVDSNGDFTGLIEVKKSIALTTRIQATAGLNLEVDGNASGIIETNGDLVLAVGANLANATITVGEDLTLTVGKALQTTTITVQGDILAPSKIAKDVTGSIITGGRGVELDIDGSLIKTRLSSGIDEGTVTVGRKITNSRLFAGRDLTVSAGKGGINGSEILPDGTLTLQVTGAIRGSQIGSKSDSLEAIVTASAINSQFMAADEGKLTVGKNLLSSRFVSGSDATIHVTGQVASSRFVSGSDLTMDVGAAIRKSKLLPANGLDLQVGYSLLGSTVQTSDGDAFLTIGGGLAGTTVDSGENLSIDMKSVPIANTVTIRATEDVAIRMTGDIASNIFTGGNVAITTDGAFAGILHAGGNVDFNVGSIAGIPTTSTAPTSSTTSTTTVAPPTAVTPTTTVTPTPPAAPRAGIWVGGNYSLTTKGAVGSRPTEVAGDLTGLSVGGTFNTALRVAGNFVTGATDTTVTVINGAVASSALIEIDGNIGSSTSASKIVFGNAFSGRLQVGGRLLADLDFESSANRINIAGGSGAAMLGDKIADIVVKGNLTSLNSGSLFNTTGTGRGDFVDGAGNVIGTLEVDGTLKTVTQAGFP